VNDSLGLRAGSPAIDVGDNDAVPGGVTTGWTATRGLRMTTAMG